MRVQRVFFVPILAAFAAAILSIATAATSLERMSVAQIARSARLIVRVECVANFTSWDAGEVWTFTSFEIESSWKGAPPAARITVRLLGGRVGNLTSSVSGVPRFRPGEKVVLFLEPSSRGDFSVVSWMQGTFRIRRDARTGKESVTQDTAAFATFNPGKRQFENSGVQGLALDTFRAQVSAALGEKTGTETGAKR